MRIYQVPTQDLIKELAKELKNHVAMPEWASFVKTGPGRERPPQQADWFFLRSAAVLRLIAVQGPIGTQKLRTKFGSRKNKGYQPERFCKAGGSVIRDILQQLDKSGLTKQELKSIHKGRTITPKGQSLLDKIAKQLIKIAPKQKEQSAPAPASVATHGAAPAPSHKDSAPQSK